jgi:hypothetical protein
MATATGSRTAIAASIVTVAALFVVRPAVDAGRRIGARGAIAGIVLTVALVASVQIVRSDFGSSDLPNRPADRKSVV